MSSAPSWPPSTPSPHPGSSGRSGPGRATSTTRSPTPAPSHLEHGDGPELAARIAAFLERHADGLRALGPPVLIHADLTAEHVMLQREGGRLAA